MRLKKIRLAGFKSFVDPTNIPFPDAMTAIVGPNGCGKSNVIDAVRWVLGESSAKNLRGDAMTDVIFNGSSARKPVGQCSVELVFEDVQQRLSGEYAKYNELSIKRVVTRDATSSYFLNGAKCRRRDVTDLFLGTGLGPRSYAIIEQGMISRLIESKPQELRVFIEEAAGISKYKERRRETETRIRHTHENLERLEDVASELTQQLEKLQRQATAAEKYRQLKAQERQLKAELAAIRWRQFTEQHKRIVEQVEELEQQKQRTLTQQQKAEASWIDIQVETEQLKRQLDELQQRQFICRNEITRLEQDKLHQKQRLRQLDEDQAETNAQLESQRLSSIEREQRLTELEQRLTSLEPEISLAEQQYEEANEQVAESEEQQQELQQRWQTLSSQAQEYRNQLSSAQSHRERSEALLLRNQQELKRLLQQRQTLTDELPPEAPNTDQHQQQQAAIDTIEEQLEQCLELQQQAAQQLQAAEQRHLQLYGQIEALEAEKSTLNSLLRDVGESDDISVWLENHHIDFQPLWQYLNIDKQWQIAAEHVLGNWLNSPVVSNYQSVTLGTGQGVLFLDRMTADKQPGTLAEVCLCERVPGWLNSISLADCPQSPRNSDANSWILTNGDWFGPDWQKRAGQVGTLGRAERFKAVCELIPELRTQREDVEQQRTALASELQQLEQQATQLISQKNQSQRELDKLNHQKALAQQQRQLIAQRDKALTQSIEQLSDEQQKLERECAVNEARLESLAERGDDTLLSVDQAYQKLESGKHHLSQCQSKVQQAQQRLHQLALVKQQLVADQNAWQRERQQAEQVIEQLSQRLNKIQRERQQLVTPGDNNEKRLATLIAQQSEIAQQQARLQGELAQKQQVFEQAKAAHQDWQQNINQLQQQQDSLRLESEGHKVRADAELDKLNEMKQNLHYVLQHMQEGAGEKAWQQSLSSVSMSLQRLGAVNLAAVEEYQVQLARKANLDEQLADLNQALETLEGAIRKIDKETRSRFKATFDSVNQDLQQLFPKVFGGGSAYLALTDDDLLETGVTIMAQPPGKKNSTIHLLSGGEKALTALSLVFAIFRLNPAPFCLLDEVDAPLDDANVMRFCNLVSEMAENVQFIYITHNKIAMEMAAHLTGVTMAEPGVSRMVSVDVEQAVALAEA